MLKLIDHIVRISARRDRTEINTALLEAMLDIFGPRSLRIYRCFTSGSKIVVFACAGFGEEGSFSHNAYLPERRFCKPIEQDRLLLQAYREASIVLDVLPNGSNRLVFPVNSMNRLIYLVDIVISETFPADQRVLLMGLVEYFTHHIALLDYGEGDTLTGLANRKTFDKHLFEVLGKAANDEKNTFISGQRRRKGSQDGQHWLAVCDIDHFKRVNDTYGHLIGDEVLVMFARLMSESFRYDDQLFRFGGEEFIAVLQPAKQSSVHDVFERFRQAVETQVFSRVGHVTVSNCSTTIPPPMSSTVPMRRFTTPSAMGEINQPVTKTCSLLAKQHPKHPPRVKLNYFERYQPRETSLAFGPGGCSMKYCRTPRTMASANLS